MTRILAIANQKGGVGKTTTTINLGKSLHALNQHVLIVDLDPQAHASFGLGFKKTNHPHGIGSVFQNRQKIHSVIRSVSSASPFSFDICPVSESFGTETQILKTQPDQLQVLCEFTQYDYILIDTPPALNFLTFAAMLTATGCIVPVQSEFFAFASLTRLLRFIQAARKQNHGLTLDGILTTMVTLDSTHCIELIAQAEPLLGGSCMFNTLVPRDIKFSESQSHQLPILDYSPQSAGAQAYQTIARELLVRHLKLPNLDSAPPKRSGLIDSSGILQFESAHHPQSSTLKNKRKHDHD